MICNVVKWRCVKCCTYYVIIMVFLGELYIYMYRILYAVADLLEGDLRVTLRCLMFSLMGQVVGGYLCMGMSSGT